MNLVFSAIWRNLKRPGSGDFNLIVLGEKSTLFCLVLLSVIIFINVTSMPVGYMMDDPSFESRHRKENLSLLQIFRKVSVAQSASYSISTGSLPRIKWPKPDVRHSPPHTAEVNNERSCRLRLIPMCFHGVDRANLPVYFQPQLTLNVDFPILCSFHGLPIPRLPVN